MSTSGNEVMRRAGAVNGDDSIVFMFLGRFRMNFMHVAAKSVDSLGEPELARVPAE
jgi:hypothetical protein